MSTVKTFVRLALCASFLLSCVMGLVIPVTPADSVMPPKNMLVIPDADIDIPLVTAGNRNGQTVVDKEDCAGYFPDFPTPTIVDHCDQGFLGIRDCVPGKTIATVWEEGNLRHYRCIAQRIGLNTLHNIVDPDKTKVSLLTNSNADLIMYTCVPNTEREMVYVVYWKQCWTELDSLRVPIHAQAVSKGVRKEPLKSKGGIRMKITDISETALRAVAKIDTVCMRYDDGSEAYMEPTEAQKKMLEDIIYATLLAIRSGANKADAINTAEWIAQIMAPKEEGCHINMYVTVYNRLHRILRELEQKQNEKESIRRIAYAKYQMEWMLLHGITVSDIVETAEEAAQASAREEDFPRFNAADFSDYLESQGFKGSLWVSYEEFLQIEYKDTLHMENLLRYNGGSDKLYALYVEDVGGTVVDWYDALQLVNQAVEKGVLTKDPDSGKVIVVTMEDGEQIRTEQSVENLARDLRFDEEGRKLIQDALDKAVQNEQT